MLKAILFICFLIAIPVMAYFFFKSKKFDSFLKNIFGKKETPDQLLNDILEVEKKASQAEKQIVEDAKNLKGDLDTVKRVRKGINVK